MEHKISIVFSISNRYNPFTMNTKPTDQTSAISYTRFSTGEQAKGDSYRRQTEAAENYCERNGLKLLDDFFDSGISAFKGTNADEGALRELIERAKNGLYPKGTILIVESLDRISRQEISRALRLFLEILEAGFDLVTLSDGERVYRHDKTELVDLIISLVVLSRANEESEMKSQRILASWKNRRKLAVETGKMITAVCPAWLEARNGKFYAIPERVKIIKEMFRLSVEKNMGATAICSHFDNQGIKTWRVNGNKLSGRWSKTYVSKIFTNPAILGFYQPQKRINGILVNAGDPIPGYYPEIIKPDYFNRNKAIIKKRKIFDVGRPTGKKNINLFKGLIYCSNCGKSIQLNSKCKSVDGDMLRYLFCSGKCGLKPFRYDQFEPMALSLIPSIDSRDMNGINNMIRTRNETREGSIISKKTELKLLKERWIVSKSPTILEMIEGIESEIAELTSQMEVEQMPTSKNFYDKIKSIKENMVGSDQSWRPIFRENVTRIIKRIDLNTATHETRIELINGDVTESTIKPGVEYHVVKTTKA